MDPISIVQQKVQSQAQSKKLACLCRCSRGLGLWILAVVCGGVASCFLYFSEPLFEASGVRDAVVVGPSMSPTLWGPHYRARCEQCNWRHRVHLQWVSPGEGEPESSSVRKRCFRCGQMALVLGPLHSGDQVRIQPFEANRNDESVELLRVGEMVAIETANSTIQVKRIVGLPGQRMTIDAHGILRADGQVISPDIPEAWYRGVEVYTTDGLAQDSPGQRFRSMGMRTPDWKWAQASWSVDLDGSRRWSDWLVYSHRNIHWEGRPSVIHDDDPANLGLRRETYPIEDLGLFIEMDTEVEGVDFVETQMVLTLKPGSQWGVCCAFPPGRRKVRILFRDARCFSQMEPWDEPPELLEIVDSPQSIWGEELVRLSSTEPFAMKVCGEGTVRLHTIELRRPVRYDAPREYAAMWLEGVTLAEQQFMVVGDNGPGSSDSRAMGKGVARDKMIGRILDDTE